jgi:UDP-N-acetylmuramate dehydrogenase
LIPGTVGAAPMQNIGAYGVELRNTLDSVETFEISTGKKKVFKNSECKFGYRDSVFKNELKGKYFISAVTLRLSKIPKPNISYKILSEYLTQNKINTDSPKNISDAVEAIRRSKLPDPTVIGNAGSFFKNILLKKEEAGQFLEKYPEAPYFKEDDLIKIPAGWLIEKCGLKGYRVGNVGVHDKQALVLVNYCGATGQEIKDLALHIIDVVFSRFGVTLVPEVNFI